MINIVVSVLLPALLALYAVLQMSSDPHLVRRLRTSAHITPCFLLALFVFPILTCPPAFA